MRLETHAETGLYARTFQPFSGRENTLVDDRPSPWPVYGGNSIWLLGAARWKMATDKVIEAGEYHVLYSATGLCGIVPGVL